MSTAVWMAVIASLAERYKMQKSIKRAYSCEDIQQFLEQRLAENDHDAISLLPVCTYGHPSAVVPLHTLHGFASNPGETYLTKV